MKPKEKAIELFNKYSKFCNELSHMIKIRF